MVLPIISLASLCAAALRKSRDVRLPRASFLQPCGPIGDYSDGNRGRLFQGGVYQKALTIPGNAVTPRTKWASAQTAQNLGTKQGLRTADLEGGAGGMHFCRHERATGRGVK